MGTKTISIMDDAYKLLLLNKLKNESFSEVIRRNFVKQKNLMKFAGIWSNNDSEDVKEIIKKQKEKTNIELKNRINDLI